MSSSGIFSVSSQSEQQQQQQQYTQQEAYNPIVASVANASAPTTDIDDPRHHMRAFIHTAIQRCHNNMLSYT